MNFSPKVSVIIPVYNGSNYLNQAIDSALAQTYKNIEIIVVNDGSNDDGATEKIAFSYGDKIRYFSKENGKVASALNFAISRMSGEYFSWLSHDDRYFPEKIEHQLNVLSLLEDKTTILYGGYQVIDSNSKPLYLIRPDSILSSEKLNISLLPLLRGLIHGCSLLIHRKYFFEISMFNEALPSTQDYALWFEFFRIAPLHFDSKILIQSRVHPEQDTHKIKEHIEECNALWSSFLKRLTDEEMILMEGSVYRFLLKSSQFLSSALYDKAEKLAISMIEKHLSNIKVSVVIPFYNRIGWTIEAIHSVQAQTHQEFEIILVDDGSTDNLESLFEIIRLDNRIKYIKQINSGSAKARNSGIALATGYYIAFLDSDDLFDQEKLDIQIRYMEENELFISHTSYFRIDSYGKVIGFINSGSLNKNAFPNIMINCPIAAPSVMVRREVFDNYFFQEKIDIGEDVCLWISLVSRYKFGGISKGLSFVRVTEESAAINFRKQVIGHLNIAIYIMRDSYLCQYESYVKILLLNTLKLILNRNNFLNFLIILAININCSLFKLFSSICRSSFITTMQRLFLRYR